MNDVAPELLETITNEFEDLIKNDEVLFGIRRKIKAGKATYQDANRASIRIGELLSKAYQSHLSSDVLPDGTMYYNIAKRVLEPTLKRDFDEVSGICQDVQQLLNQKANIGIKAVAADLNQDRIDGIIDKVSSAPYKKTQWITKEPVVNFSQSIVDDHIKANADFHAKSGLSPKIVRRSSGKCCEWCSKLVGTYRYPEEAPDGSDVWRRHNNCRCTVDYDPGDGKVQDVWSKKWKEEIPDELDEMGLVKSIKMDRFKKNSKEIETTNIKVHLANQNLNIYQQTNSHQSQQTVEYLKRELPKYYDRFGRVDEVYVLKPKDMRGIAAYDNKRNSLFINEEITNPKFIKDQLSDGYFAANSADDILYHELSHKLHWDNAKRLMKSNGSKYDTIESAKMSLESNLRSYIKQQLAMDPFYLQKVISLNAHKGMTRWNKLNEAIADANVLIKNGNIPDPILQGLIEEILS